VASRLTRNFNLPVAVVSVADDGTGRGSCRGIEEIDVTQILAQCSRCLTSYGGHRGAGGFSVKSGMTDEFGKLFRDACLAALGGRRPAKSHSVDGWLLPGEINLDLCRAVARLRPFGAGNPAPVWGLRNCRIVERPRILKNRHVRMLLQSGADQFNAIAFGMADEPFPEGDMDVLFEACVNDFRGRETVDLKVVDFRPTV